MPTPITRQTIAQTLEAHAGDLSSALWKRVFGGYKPGGPQVLQWLDALGLTVMKSSQKPYRRWREIAVPVEVAMDAVMRATVDPPARQAKRRPTPRTQSKPEIFYLLEHCPPDAVLKSPLFRYHAAFTVHDMRYTVWPLGAQFTRRHRKAGRVITLGFYEWRGYLVKRGVDGYDPRILGRRVAAWRKGQGLTQKAAGQLCGLSRAYLQEIEHGRAWVISPAIITKLAGALGMTPAQLRGV